MKSQNFQKSPRFLRQQEQERLEQERLEQERLEQERLEQERLEQDMDAKLINEYRARPTWNTVTKLASKMGKSAKSIHAKLCQLGVYKEQCDAGFDKAGGCGDCEKCWDYEEGAYRYWQCEACKSIGTGSRMNWQGHTVCIGCEMKFENQQEEAADPWSMASPWGTFKTILLGTVVNSGISSIRRYYDNRGNMHYAPGRNADGTPWRYGGTGSIGQRPSDRR